MSYCGYCFKEIENNNTCPYCGNKNIEVESIFLKKNTVLKSRYQVGRILGKGGFGITYLGYDKQLQQFCAIKEYFPDMLVTRNHNISNEVIVSERYLSKYEKLLSGYYKEAEILNSISDADTIVKLFDYFYVNNTAYIVMEFVEGETILDILNTRTMDYREIKFVVESIAKAMVAAHKYGVIHRDIGLGNILLTKTHQVKLIDFGAARYFSANEVKEMSVIFNPSFAPPEQYNRKGHQGPWTDVYALCSCAYQMITQSNPPDARERLNGIKLLNLFEYSDQVPSSFIKIILKGMDLDYKNRFQTMQELINAINQQTKTSEKPNAEFYFVYITYNNHQSKYRVPIDQAISIGRINCSININCIYVSKLHCYLAFDKSHQRFAILNKSINGIRNAHGELANSIYIHTRGCFYIIDQRIEVVVDYEGGIEE